MGYNTAQAAREAGARVTGIVPRQFVESGWTEIVDREADELIQVEDMHTRCASFFGEVKALPSSFVRGAVWWVCRVV